VVEGHEQDLKYLKLDVGTNHSKMRNKKGKKSVGNRLLSNW
jgi:hypothetical protein